MCKAHFHPLAVIISPFHAVEMQWGVKISASPGKNTDMKEEYVKINKDFIFLSNVSQKFQKANFRHLFFSSILCRKD
jgi:hypothetical protein